MPKRIINSLTDHVNFHIWSDGYLTNLYLGEWSTPSVTGEPPPPCAGFTLTKISHTSALLYGGYNPQSGTCIRDSYIIQMTHDGIVSDVFLHRHDPCYYFISSIGRNWI